MNDDILLTQISHYNSAEFLLSNYNQVMYEYVINTSKK